jgi:HK97 gp10 family phage protein
MATVGRVKLTWQGPAITAQVLQAIDAGLEDTGQAAKQEAQRRARVDTGEMRDSIDFTVSGGSAARILTLSVGTDHGLFNEVGTSRMPAQPMIRPALDIEGPKLDGRIRAHLGGR